MERNLARRLIEAVMPKDKRQAVPTIRALIDEAEVHLEHYGNQAQAVELRNPAELVQARRKISEALELSDEYDLTMMGENARQIERQTLDALTFWGEQRRQMIEATLATDKDTLPPEFSGWVEEYRLCFPDKEALVSDWREQKTVLEIHERFEQDYQESAGRVRKLQDEAKALYNADPVNNEGNAIGAMRRAYEEAKRLADNYIAEQAARDLAIEAKTLYEKRKETWSKSLVTSARFAQFKRVRKQWEQARRAGEEKVVPYEAVLDEDGELIFGFDEGEEILTLVEGEPVPIDEALSRLSDIEFKYADTKTSEYIRIADGQVETNPRGAIDTLEEFGTRHIDVLRATHKKRLEAKLEEYQERLQQRQQAEHMLEKARTEQNGIEAWRFILKAEALDKRTTGLANAKAGIGRQVQVVIEQEVLPRYQRIGIFEREGNQSWDNQIAYLSDLQSLIAGYEPLQQSHYSLGRIIDDLRNFRDLDAEINEKLPEIQAKLKEAPDEADEELEALEYRLIKLQRAALYPAVQNTRQIINTHLNIHSQKRVWLAEIDDENRLLHNLAAIEAAVEEFAHLEDPELDRIYKRYQARAMLRALETDREYGLLSEGLQAEVESIDIINSLLQEADETDAELIAKVNRLSRWLNQKKHDYDEIVKQLPPLQEKIEAGDYVAADSMFDILFGLYPDDPTLNQRKNQMEVEWKIHLMEGLTRRAIDLDRVRTMLAPGELRKILNDIDKLQELASESVVRRFEELKACCYLGLARAEPRQKRYWLQEAERVAPEASTAFGYVKAELNELQREDDFSELAGESDEQKRVLRLERMRVRYPNDTEILELLADLYLKRGEPLKAQSIVEHMKILQRRGEAPGLDIDTLETRIQELIKTQDWKRLVVEQLDPEASLDSLKAANDLMREVPLRPGSPNYQALEEWYDSQKRDFANVLLRQAKDLRDRDADLVDICEKMVQVWMFMPQAREAKDALEELGMHSLDLQRELEQESKDTSGKMRDAPDWLNQQIKRVDSLIIQAKKVSRVLEVYYERGGDAEERRYKSVSLREQIEALTNHKRELGRLRTELAVLQAEWREVRESRNPDDIRWDSLERRANSLQTGTNEYTVLKRLRQHEQVKYLFNQVMKSRADQRKLQKLFVELQRSVDQGLDQAALKLIGEIRGVVGWEKYRFEDDLSNIQTISTPVTLASLETLLRERNKLLDEVDQRILTHTRRLRRWRETHGLWETPERERLLNHPEMTEVLQRLGSRHTREIRDAVDTYRRMLKEIHTDRTVGPVSEEGYTVQRAVHQCLRSGKWEEAIIHCWRAAFNEPKQETRIQEELGRYKNEANANNNPGPFVKRVKDIAARIASPGENDLSGLGSWHYFLKLTESFPLILPEESANPRMALELAHMEMIRLDVQDWLSEARQEIEGIASIFRQFVTHYIVAQQSLDRLKSVRWQMFKRRELERVATSGQLAYNECRRICPDYPYPQPLRERFE